jgi:hypothetical protein
MSAWIKLLGATDRVVWGPLERLNEKRRVAQLRARGNAASMAKLRQLESFKGKVSANVIRKCDEYAAEVFGWKGYAPSLYVYSAMAGEFKDGWVPGMYYNLVVVPVTSADFGDLSLVKSLGGQLLKSDRFPDVARKMQGIFYDDEFRLVRPEHLKDTLFRKGPKIVFKADNSRKGKSVEIFDQDSFDLQQVGRLGNGIFQYFVDQHETLKELSPIAAATLRMTTVVDRNGDVSVRSCYLRVGRKDDSTIRSSSQIRILVDPREGRFAPMAFLPNSHEIAAHPDTGVTFEGGSYPFYSRCVDAVAELHARVPYVSCIGWDVCVDSRNEPKVFEWNGRHNAVGFGEAMQGPCFADLGWEKLWRREGTPAARSA